MAEIVPAPLTEREADLLVRRQQILGAERYQDIVDAVDHLNRALSKAAFAGMEVDPLVVESVPAEFGGCDAVAVRFVRARWAR